jgi:hypothetical protein
MTTLFCESQLFPENAQNRSNRQINDPPVRQSCNLPEILRVKPQLKFGLNLADI